MATVSKGKDILDTAFEGENGPAVSSAKTGATDSRVELPGSQDVGIPLTVGYKIGGERDDLFAYLGELSGKA